MRAQEFIIENADQAAVDALLKKHGWSMGRTVNGDLAFTWQGSTYVFYGERMRINFPNGQSVSVVWGHKPDWHGRGNEFSFAQAVQRKLLTFDLPIWQALDRGQINDTQALQKFKAENERQAREAIAQGVTEGREKFNQEIMQPGFEFRLEINGVTYEVTNDQGFGPVVTVTDKNNEVIAQAGFWKHKTRPGLESLSTHVEPEWQGQGIAANMYALMRMLGANISPSTNQTDDGQAMWAKWEKQGDADHIKSMNSKRIAENIKVDPVARPLPIQKTITQPKQNVYVAPEKKSPAAVIHIKPKNVTEGKLDVDVPNEDWLQDKIDYARSKGRNSYGVPYFGSTTAHVRGTPPRVRVMRLASLPGMKDEQNNVRKADLKWLMDYMDKTGKLPPMGSNPNEEYLPYIMVAYNGEAWVNEGNHRIMAAYRLNWPDLPIEIRYFDGGERIATGPMAPGKIGLA